MQSQPHVDTTRSAVVGFDFGGLAALLLAMRNSDVGAVVTLDAGIMFEHNLALLRQFAEYEPLRLRVPLMQVTAPAAENAARGLVEDLSLFRGARFSSTYLLRIAGMDHPDFTTYGMLWSATRSKTADPRSHVLGYETMSRYVLRFLDASLRHDSAAAAFLAQSPDANGDQQGLLTIQRTTARPIPPTEAEFVRVLLEVGTDSASRLATVLQAADSGFVPFTERRMNQLGLELLAWHQLPRAEAVFQLNLRAYPRSWLAYDGLGEVFLLRGDTASAASQYSRALELNPGEAHATAMLKKLRGR
jgi:tetratricopeptide (TPR) repeat protein